MGSVGPEYRCPVCGRRGNGGYALDAVGYPVCTESDNACLWVMTTFDRSPAQMLGLALAQILRPRPALTLPAESLDRIGAFLIGELIEFPAPPTPDP